MHVSENQYHMLKDVHLISRLDGFSGCLPHRDALLYDTRELTKLMEAEYVKEVTLEKPCGGEIRGLKLTREGKWLLRRLEGTYAPDKGTSCSVSTREHECLTRDLEDILRDMYHYSRLKKANGLFPRREARSYPQDDLEFLYLNGYLLKIRMSTKPGKKEKGFVLSSKGEQLVRSAEEAEELLT